MDLLFYHLERSPLERVLPDLLTKSLAKGWQVIVETHPAPRVEALDQMLWTYSDESFLPHGIEGAPFAETQPILLTASEENTNNADVRFFVDGGDVTKHVNYQRLVYLFNGNDDEAVSRARGEWQSARKAELDITYWQEGPGGGFTQKA